MPDPSALRVAVVGPGAIGAAVAAIALEGGHQVTLCGRTPAGSIVVCPDDGPEVVVPGPVLTDPGAAPAEVDLVLVAVKAHQTEGAVPWLRALSPPGGQAPVVALQNGVEQRAMLRPHVSPQAPVVPSVVWFPAEVTEPGRVRLRLRPSITLPDEPGAGLAQGVLSGGCDVDLASDFPTVAWRKLTLNAVAALLVLSGRRAAVYGRPDVHGLSRALALECLAVARAEGADLPDTVADEIMAQFEAMPPDMGTSMLFDREAGRELEWDARNGVVQRLGARHGVPTPISDVIVPLLAAASGEA
ncbi:oxidoreductase [Baekduia soli]|uniref:Oxidoreductase n=1 Tax=Baekduia soli TaxID=496014 RepID=A0A5B8U8J2_9ACTN|nr:oxidoreductase [Baekduia soli]QEC49443.1 oxidoreductase [Baekduia soli]